MLSSRPRSPWTRCAVRVCVGGGGGRAGEQGGGVYTVQVARLRQQMSEGGGADDGAGSDEGGGRAADCRGTRGPTRYAWGRRPLSRGMRPGHSMPWSSEGGPEGGEGGGGGRPPRPGTQAHCVGLLGLLCRVASSLGQRLFRPLILYLLASLSLGAECIGRLISWAIQYYFTPCYALLVSDVGI